MLYKRPLKVRQMGLGKQITVPAESEFQVGDETIVFYNSIMLVVPKGTRVNEDRLAEAIPLVVQKEIPAMFADVPASSASSCCVACSGMFYFDLFRRVTYQRQ